MGSLPRLRRRAKQSDSGMLRAVIKGYLAGNIAMDIFSGKLRVAEWMGMCLFGGRSRAIFVIVCVCKLSYSCGIGNRCDWFEPLDFNIIWDSESASASLSLPGSENSRRQGRQMEASASWPSRAFHSEPVALLPGLLVSDPILKVHDSRTTHCTAHVQGGFTGMVPLTSDLQNFFILTQFLI